MRKIIFGTVAALVWMALSCSRTEPVIAFGFIELFYYQDTGGAPSEYFSFFIIPEDDDGIENLADLYLYHDREQLQWHISSDDWVSHVEGGNTWIGSRSIAIGEAEHLPRGQFRAVLINKGGERSERLFTFDAPQTPAFPFPTIEIRERQYTVVSSYPVNQLIFYDDEGNFLNLLVLDELRGSIDNLDIPGDARSASLWAQNPEHLTSAFTDAAALYF